MSQPTTEILLTHDEGIAWIELNRPRRRHALSESLLQELDTTLAALADDRSTRVIVIASSGPVFSSGHDLGEMTGRSAEEYEQIFQTCSRVMQRIRQLPQPVIARVQGLATAAGCQLVAACDLAVADEQAKFATPGIKIGLFCTTPMVPLARSVPSKIAMEMLLTGEPITATQAAACGLINAAVPSAEMDDVIRRYARAITSSSRQVIALGKRAFYEQRHLDETAAYGRAVEIMTHNAVMPDAQEGMSAFLEKRPPRWEE